MTAAAIIKNKGSNVYTVLPQTLIIDAVKILWDGGVGTVVVSEDENHINGILSERDIVRALGESGPDCLNLPVSTIMTREVKTCTSTDKAIAIMGMMNQHRIRHVPVVDDGKMVGLISMGDIVKRRLDEVEADASAMLEYINKA
ncbi:MAG: CBS domain-containing protein [Rhodospirillales bacterium]|nr:CBS domain-containing protein [Rhodospirillales bacterium]